MLRIYLFLGLLLVPGCVAPQPSGADVRMVEAVADGEHGERFLPSELVVDAGQEVTFRVVGATPHTVDFENTSGVSAPHSGHLTSGATFVVRFTEAGTFSYYCQYHIPGMVGRIIVR